MKKIVIVLFILFLIVLAWGNQDNFSEEEDLTNTSWYSPSSAQTGEIGRVLAKKNIRDCGEFHIKETGYASEYLVACTSDGKNWTYYVVYTAIEDVLLASKEMERTLTPPR